MCIKEAIEEKRFKQSQNAETAKAKFEKYLSEKRKQERGGVSSWKNDLERA